MFNNKTLFFVFIFIYNFTFAQTNTVSFSHEAGFYNDAFYLKLNIERGELFYFDENTINKKRKVFPDSLLINKTSTISLLVDHADSIHKLGSFSYFIGFNTDFKVVSISIDNDFLFNKYKGIYEKGPRAYFDTVSQHYRNVNWERKWERENFVEVFNEEGDRIIGQSSGLRIFGGMTKYYPEKSLRLIARTKYKNNRFDADLFNKGKKKYKQFILRHSGNDYRKLRFKDAFITSLGAESNLDVQASSPAHLFINAEYWGVYNIREKINKFYINNNHNTTVSSIDILQGYKTVEEGTQGTYNKLLNFVKKNNLSIAENYVKVQEMMDTRNFANFWIHQIYSANHDARGNIRFWRSDSLDGKFRWILYDTDLAFHPSKRKDDILKDFTSPTKTNWYNPRWATFLLRNLLKNESFKKDFILQSSYLLSSTLGTQNIKERINEFKILYEDEMKVHFSKRKKFQSYQGNLNKWNNSIQGLFMFAEERDEISLTHLEKNFHLKKPYSLQIKITNFEKGQVFLNGNIIKKTPFNAKFYSEFALPITLQPNIGFTSEGYLYDTINAKSGDSLIINISFVQNEESAKKVIINEIDYVNDCFEIFNQEHKSINLTGWKIIDKNNNIYTIKKGLLKKGRFLVFHNKIIDNKIDSVDYLKINFKLSSSSELLMLYDSSGSFVDSISYNLTEIKNSYSRNIPFENTEETPVTWENNSQSTIGYHNKYYTTLISHKLQKDLQKKKKKRILLISAGMVMLVPLLFFLIRKRKAQE